MSLASTQTLFKQININTHTHGSHKHEFCMLRVLRVPVLIPKLIKKYLKLLSEIIVGYFRYLTVRVWIRIAWFRQSGIGLCRRCCHPSASNFAVASGPHHFSVFSLQRIGWIPRHCLKAHAKALSLGCSLCPRGS